MLIHALSEYYDILSKNGKLVGDAYSKVGINYIIVLSEDGEITGVVDNHEEITDGKKTKRVAKDEILPKRVEIPGICANIIEHRPLYIFGLNYDKSEDIFSPDDKTNKAQKSHQDFVTKNISFIEKIDTPVVCAYKKFIENFSPENECNNEFLALIKKDYQTARMAFCLNDTSNLLHRDTKLLHYWNEKFNEVVKIVSDNMAICAISGEKSEIARVHDKIKGFNAMGSVLIGVKESAMCSYTNEQGFNAGVSTKIMGKYTKALNYLLADRKHRTMLDDITLLHFAKSSEPIYDDIISFSFDFSYNNKMDENQAESAIKSLLNDAKSSVLRGESLNLSDKLDENIEFYIIGLKPNSSRLAIKFIYKQKFGEILENIAKHQVDLMIKDDARSISLWQIQKELKSPVSKNANIDPSLATKLMQSILYCYEYPQALLSTVIRRIKTDSNSDTNSYIKINDTRVSIIKACLNRSSRLNGKEEEITMALNLENTSKAYLCGRLFSVLEDLQNDASGGNLNKTIKDAYFSSACSKPSLIFPKLLKLANHHIQKAKEKRGYDSTFTIREIMSKLDDEFPDTLSLKDQGKFIIGYYQQSQRKYQGKTKEEK